MSQKIDEQIEGGLSMENQFNDWIYEVCLLKGNPQKAYNNLDLTDAKLAFLGGMSAEEYSKTL